VSTETVTGNTRQVKKRQKSAPSLEIPLKRLAVLIGGQSPSSNDVEDFDGSGIPFLQGTAEFGKIHPNPLRRCEVGAKHSEIGDILISVRAPVGTLNNSDRKYAIGRGLCSVRPSDIHRQFCWWSLHERIETLDALSVGTTYKAVTIEDIRTLKIRVPSPQAQIGIADFLDRETNRIDAIIDARLRMIELLAERRQAVITETVTGSSVVSEKGQETFSLRLVETPKEWGLIRLGVVTARSKLANRPDLPPLSVFLDQGVVPRSSRSDNHNQLGSDLSKYLHVQVGDLVFNKLRTWQGGLGVSAYEGVVSPAYFVCRPTPAIHPEYLHYLLRSDVYLGELTRTSKFMPPSQFDISWDDLKTLPILMPPLSEQQQIADFLDRETNRIDAIIGKCRESVALLRERRQALITAAVTGELEVAA
jgi:type I restriction enzyme, S subunit